MPTLRAAPVMLRSETTASKITRRLRSMVRRFMERSLKQQAGASDSPTRDHRLDFYIVRGLVANTRAGTTKDAAGRGVSVPDGFCTMERAVSRIYLLSQPRHCPAICRPARTQTSGAGAMGMA